MKVKFRLRNLWQDKLLSVLPFIVVDFEDHLEIHIGWLVMSIEIKFKPKKKSHGDGGY